MIAHPVWALEVVPVTSILLFRQTQPITRKIDLLLPWAIIPGPAPLVSIRRFCIQAVITPGLALLDSIKPLHHLGYTHHSNSTMQIARKVLWATQRILAALDRPVDIIPHHRLCTSEEKGIWPVVAQTDRTTNLTFFCSLSDIFLDFGQCSWFYATAKRKVRRSRQAPCVVASFAGARQRRLRC